MSIADELTKLDALRSRGALSDAEFERAKQRLLDGPAPPPAGQAPGVSAINGFRRSATDKWLGGVCGGLATLTGLDSWAWRLILTVLFLFGGFGGLLYLLLWIFVPAE
jgi:phage shock protein PspC (stress-responsive transcriptional regulator)